MSGWKISFVGPPQNGKATNAGPPFGILCFLCFLWPFLPACSKRSSDSQQVLRLAQRNEPATLDPHLATLPDEFFIIRALGEGLLTPNPDGGSPLPGIAESWSVSPDGLVYTFRLRPDAQWSNGDPVTADDFAYSIRRVLTPTTAAPKAPLFFSLKNAREFFEGKIGDFAQVGVAARDAHTLVLTLGHTNQDLPALAASGPWIPVHRPTVEARGRHWTRPGSHTGNGMFTLREWSPNQHIVVRKNPAYWDHANVHLEVIRFLAFDSGDTEDRAFRAGQVDVTLAVPFARLDSYRHATPAMMQTVKLHETRYLALNNQVPPLNDVRVRRALSLSLDRNVLVDKVLKGGQTAGYHLIPPGLGGHRPAATITEDAGLARQLLAEAGFPNGRNFPRLELATWVGAGNLVIEAIQQRWHSQLGIDVSLVQREARTHLAAMASGDYQIAFATAIPDYDSAADLLQHFTAGDAGNYPHWSNPAYDRLVANHALPDAEKLLLETLPVIPLYFNAKNFLRRPAVRAWREDALWTRYYKHVHLGQE
jgi:oligopeptide transport system substrate-binding protein